MGVTVRWRGPRIRPSEGGGTCTGIGRGEGIALQEEMGPVARDWGKGSEHRGLDLEFHGVGISFSQESVI